MEISNRIGLLENPQCAKHLVESGLNGGGDAGDGLQARGALPVDGMHRNGVWDAGKKRGDAGLVGPLGAGSQDTADDNVTNILLTGWEQVGSWVGKIM